MREIKFRAYDHIMISPSKLMVKHNNRYLNESLVSDENISIMQFTGVKDSHSVDIYEGDIVRFDVINLTADFGQKYLSHTGEVKISPSGVSFGAWKFGWVCNLEVIGNIHQNPELLVAAE